MDDRERHLQLFRSIAPLGQAARELAQKNGHARTGVAHLAVVLLERPEVQKALRACKIDVEEIADLAQGMLADERPRPWWRFWGASPSPELAAVLDHAFGHAWGAGLERITPVFVLVYLLSEEPRSLTAERLDAMGVEPLPLKLYDAHGRAHDAPFPEGHGPVIVVAHNDPYTPFDLVTELFTTTFGLPPDEAEREMLAVHHGGRAEFRFSDWEVGRARADAARRIARERGFPLAFSLERAAR